MYYSSLSHNINKQNAVSLVTWNARPGPEETTSPTATPFFSAMNPRNEKMTNPAKNEVEQLMRLTVMASFKQLLSFLLYLFFSKRTQYIV